MKADEFILHLPFLMHKMLLRMSAATSSGKTLAILGSNVTLKTPSKRKPVLSMYAGSLQTIPNSQQAFSITMLAMSTTYYVDIAPLSLHMPKHSANKSVCCCQVYMDRSGKWSVEPGPNLRTSKPFFVHVFIFFSYSIRKSFGLLSRKENCQHWGNENKGMHNILPSGGCQFSCLTYIGTEFPRKGVRHI